MSNEIEKLADQIADMVLRSMEPDSSDAFDSLIEPLVSRFVNQHMMPAIMKKWGEDEVCEARVMRILQSGPYPYL